MAGASPQSPGSARGTHPVETPTATGSVGRVRSAGSPEIPSLNIWFHLVASDIPTAPKSQGSPGLAGGVPSQRPGFTELLPQGAVGTGYSEQKQQRADGLGSALCWCVPGPGARFLWLQFPHLKNTRAGVEPQAWGQL